MDNKSSIMFRKAIGGYNKTDVNRYIEEASLREKKNVSVLEEKIRELEKQLAGAIERAETAEMRDFSEEAAEYDKRIKELEVKLSECERIISIKTEETDALRDKLNEQVNQTEAISAKLKENTETVKKAQDVLTKALQYDAVSSRIGEVLLSAENKAGDIMTAARIKSDEIIRSAEEKREKTVHALEKYASLYKDKLSEITVASVKERIDRLNTRMDEFKDSLSRTVMDAKDHCDTFGSCIDDLTSSLESNISSILSGKTDGTNDGEDADEIEKLIDNSANSIISRINNEL